MGSTSHLFASYDPRRLPRRARSTDSDRAWRRRVTVSAAMTQAEQSLRRSSPRPLGAAAATRCTVCRDQQASPESASGDKPQRNRDVLSDPCLEDLEVVFACALERCAFLSAERQHKCAASRPLATIWSVEDEKPVAVDPGSHRHTPLPPNCLLDKSSADL
jgi:hypothetical protein